MTPVPYDLHGAVAEATRHAKGGMPTRSTSHIETTSSGFNVFSSLLQSDGIRAALYSLLRRTDYRFIAIFRFQNGKATSSVFVDRENIRDLQAGEVADTDTYCCYVRDRGGPFLTVDAMTDDRTADHVAKDVARAYCGIPIVSPEGELIGTLCHYDLVARDPTQLDVELLLQASAALASSGLIPAYPSGASSQ